MLALVWRADDRRIQVSWFVPSFRHRSRTGNMPLPKPPPDLVEALQEHRVFVVLGSGLSTACGAPSWDDLLRQIAETATALCPAESSKIAAAQQLVQNSRHLDGASVLKEVLAAQFTRTVQRLLDLDLSPNRAHFLLATLPFRAIVTTNYDRLLETALRRSHAPDRPVYYWSDPDLASRVRDSRQFILKLHGDVYRPDTIVLAREDYARVVNSSTTRTALVSLLGTCMPLFVGYGHRDPDIDLLLDELWTTAGLGGGFALVSSKDAALDARLRSANIFGIRLDDHEQVPEFLEGLAEVVGLRLDISITIVIGKRWTTEQAAELLAIDLCTDLSRVLGEPVRIQEINPGSVILVILLAPHVAQDLRARLRRRDASLVAVLREHGVTAIDHLSLGHLEESAVAAASHLEIPTSQEADRPESLDNQWPSLTLIAPGRMVPLELVPDRLVREVADLFIHQPESTAVLHEASRMLHAESPRASVVKLAHLPAFEAGAYRFWQSVFRESCLHGPRMLAALLLSLPVDRLSDSARCDVSNLLASLSHGTYHRSE